MYIWVVLATFLAILYSFNLSIRGDERRLQVEPLAQAEVSKFVLHHRMAQQYIKERTPKTHGSRYGTDNATITYDKGILDCANKLRDYRPVGFICDNNYTSEIYCTKKDDWSTGIDDCTSENAMRFLVTYGPIPKRWLNLSSDTPNNDFLNALYDLMGIDTSVGYATGSSNNDYDMEIKGREDNSLYMPNYVVRNGGFKAACTCTNCSRCLVYLTPYE